jgi:hypothetical protein
MIVFFEEEHWPMFGKSRVKNNWLRNKSRIFQGLTHCIARTQNLVKLDFLLDINQNI